MKFGFMKYRLMNQADPSTGGEGGGGTGGQVPPAQTQTVNSGTQTQNSGNSVDDLPEWARNEIKNLRGESAKHRTTNKDLTSRLDKYEQALKKAGLVDEEVPAEERLTAVTAQAEALAINNALMEIAFENGIPKDQFKYFSFLMSEKLETLEEGQEMSEEDLQEILGQINVGPAQTANSSFGGKGANNKPNAQTGVTVEQFSKMGIMEKSKLYQTDAAEYNRLMNEAKSKGLL